MFKNRTTYFQFLLAIVTVLSVNLNSFSQAEIPQKPILETSVYDRANILSGYEKNALEQKLTSYSDTTSTQIVVATVKTINGENIALYATKWAHKWGIGQKDEDNGIFILIAKDDHKLTIQTGYGVEHLLTDALSKRIIENIITPEFKRGNFYEGLDRGTSAIMQIMSGEYQGAPYKRSSDSGIPIGFIIIFIIILFIILSNRNKGRGGRGGRRRSTGSILDAIILSNAGRGGFGGGGGFGSSSGGGGFSGGFGGGGFGGGGASGGW